MVKEIDVDGEYYEVHIEYQIVGRYIPATRIDPAEYPEADWSIEKAVDAEGADVTDKAILTEIEKELMRLDIETEILETAAEDAEQARADYMRDLDR